MRTGLNSQAYTIVEAMIVLAVTGALLIAAMILISGQQQRTEFNQAIRDIEARVQDVANDITTGYYANNSNFSCSSNGTTTTITYGTPPSNSLGTNAGCILLGRVLQFGVNGTNAGGVSIYNVVGQRRIGSGSAAKEVRNLQDADPIAIADYLNTTTPGYITDYTENFDLQYGLRAATMYWVNSTSGHTPIGAVGFISTKPADYDNSTGLLKSGAPAVDLVAIPNTALDNTRDGVVTQINALNDTVPINPAGGVVICFQSGGTNQYAELKIGGGNRKISTNLVVSTGTCPL